ncbi:MAG: VPLPA-CTERM sorting domain-containing protein [Hyphomicrobiales bacterium]
MRLFEQGLRRYDMFKRKLAATLAGAGLLALSTVSAQAVTYSLDASSTQRAGNTADQYAPNFGAFNPFGGSFSSDPTVTPPPASVFNGYQSPFNNTPLADVNSFFSVWTNTPQGGTPSPLLYTFDPQNVPTSFQMLWGSIDSFNVLEFLDSSNNPLYTLTGQDLVQNNSALSNVALSCASLPCNYEVVALLTFSELRGVSALRFTTSQAAFEFALVPLPPAALLFGTALGGVGFLSRRKKAAATA